MCVCISALYIIPHHILASVNESTKSFCFLYLITYYNILAFSRLVFLQTFEFPVIYQELQLSGMRELVHCGW